MIVDMSKVAAPTEPLPGRSCGGCTLCCKVLGVPALEKPRGTWCLHCERGVGCRIYESRPGECRSFLCGWLVSDRFGPEWKPERSKIVITVTRDGNGFEFQCDPGFPQAWRKEPYYSQSCIWRQLPKSTMELSWYPSGREEHSSHPEGSSRLAKSKRTTGLFAIIAANG
jgi:hypothetical protein